MTGHLKIGLRDANVEVLVSSASAVRVSIGLVVVCSWFRVLWMGTYALHGALSVSALHCRGEHASAPVATEHK